MGQEITTAELENIAKKLRLAVITMSHAAQTAHLAGSLSCVDIVTALYWRFLKIDPNNPMDPLRDRFILSKGHAASTQYAALAMRGFFDLELLNTFAQDGSALAEHPGPQCVPGIEAATGSLGHGLSMGLGFALAAKLNKQTYRVWVVLSDGECNEGTVWEAAMFAPAQNLGNVTAIVDFNKWQATSRSTETLALEPLADKWRAFGWGVREINGHDMSAIVDALAQSTTSQNTPQVIVAHTTKGKGVSFMEDDNNWHYRAPTIEEVEKARIELGL